MSETKEINPTLKAVLEIGPVLGFLGAYLWVKDDVFTIGGTEYSAFVAVTALFVPVFLVAMAILWKLTGKLSRMQVFTAVMLVVLGGLAVWLNDERFVKIKPTIMYILFGSILGIGLLRGQSYLRWIMEELMPLKDEGWMILTRRFSMFFFGMAAVNEGIWRFLSTDIFVFWDTIGQAGATIAFFLTQTGLFSKYAVEDDSAAKDS